MMNNDSLSDNQKQEVKQIAKDEASKLTVEDWTMGFMNRGIKISTIKGAIFNKGWKLEDRVSEKEFADAIEEYRNMEAK